MESDVSTIARENRRRREVFTAPYDPITGLECYGERETVDLGIRGPEQLPVSMLQVPFIERIISEGGIPALAANAGMTPDEARQIEYLVHDVRTEHDPEYWFATCCTVLTKTDGYQPFILRRPQRLFLKAMMDPYLANKQVRINLLKARQWGGSTLTQIFMAWVQQRRRTSWHVAIVADVQDQSAHIRRMYRTLARFYPKYAGSITFRPYEGQKNVLWCPDRESIIGVGSVQNPNAVRSFTYHMLHLSEVGLWKSTQEVNAESLAQALVGGMVKGPGTICVKESTAKGAGTYFHREYQASEAGRSEYVNEFVPWYAIEDYQINVPVQEVGDFVASWSDYESWLWEMGATIEGIAWYRRTKSEMPEAIRDVAMQSEFPTTPDEAFQGTGHPAFPRKYIERHRPFCKPPISIGSVVGAHMVGEGSLEAIEYIENPQLDEVATTRVSVWRFPLDDFGGLLDLTNYRIINRYCGFLDIGGRWHKADYSVLTILDRAPMLDILGNGPPEVVAELRGHADIDVIAWDAARVCLWYDGAMLAIEKNSLSRAQKKGEHVDEPVTVHSYTVLDELARNPSVNLFHETRFDKRKQKSYESYGFQTTAESKQAIIDALTGALRDVAYVERHEAALDEMVMYERKADGRMGAVEGFKDDRVISRAGTVWMGIKDQMPPVRMVEIGKPKRKRKAQAAQFT